MRRRALLALCLSLPLTAPAFARGRRDGLLSPVLRIPQGAPNAPRVALTFDACMGRVDLRILDALIKHEIPATIFVTGRWLRSNPDALAQMKAHPQLFDLENHGAMHVPAIIGTEVLYGIKPAGTLAAVRAEVAGGAADMLAHGLARPTWYRDATALYSPAALTLIKQMGYRIGGFSLNADFGASLPADKVTARMATARDGDVIIGHINQPLRSSGAGIGRGVVALKARGFEFVKLDELAPAVQAVPNA